MLGTERQIEVYRNPEQGRYREKLICRTGEVLECVALKGVRLRVAELFE